MQDSGCWAHTLSSAAAATDQQAAEVESLAKSAIADGGSEGAGATEAFDLSADHLQAINAFNDKLDSLKNEGNGLYYTFMTAESNPVWSGQVEGRPGTWATETTVFPLASASKLFTAFAVMRTMQLKPKDFYPEKYINEFKGWESFANFPVHGTSKRANLTVHHLLTHTSGLPFGMRYSRADIEKQTLFYWPGTAFGYTLGHRVLGWLMRDFWMQQPEAKDVGIETCQDVYKWLIFDELGLSCGTRFDTYMNEFFGYSGQAGDAAIQSTGADLIKLAVVALRKGRLPSGKVMISKTNWDRWAVPNLLPGGKLSKELVGWKGESANWENLNVGGLKEKIMQQSGDYGWNYFGATYYDSKEIGWCGFFSSCLRVTYPHDLAFVMMQQNVADLEKSKPYLVANFASMAQSLQCKSKTSCYFWDRSSTFCEKCSDSCSDGRWDHQCPHKTTRGKALYPDTFWSSAAHTCYVPRCTWAPAIGSQCDSDTGGTCRWLGCDASRGPADCIHGSCICKAGFCAQEGACKRPAELSTCCKDTGGTCSILGCDASRGDTSCVRGFCICNGDLCAEAGHCMAPSALSLAASNMSAATGSWAASSDGTGEVKQEVAFAAMAAAASLLALGASVVGRWRGSRGGCQKDDVYVNLLG